MKKQVVLLILSLLLIFSVTADDLPPAGEKFVYSPLINDKKVNASLGMLFTTTQKDITEEYQFRIPAIDFHVTSPLTNHLIADGEIITQVLQNHFSLGLKWRHDLGNRVSISVGDDMAYWFGILKLEGFNTKASGFMNYPNFSAGMRFGKDVLVTLKFESLLNLSVNSFVGNVQADPSIRFYSGQAISVYIEQPFYHQSWFVLGFKGMYSNYFWQTWSVYENFDRNIFYPQLIFGFML